MKIVKLKKIEIQHPPFLQERFGENYAQISVDITLKLKSSIKDVARVIHGHVPPYIEELTKKMPTPPQGVTDRDFVFGYEESGTWVPGIIETDAVLQEYVKHFPEEWKIVQRALGLARQKGRHACGFVIADKPISSFIPTQMISDYRCTQYDPGSVEAAGGLKMDFLIVTVLTDIEDCIRSIHSRSGRPIPEQMTIAGRRVPRIRLLPVQDGFVDIWDLPEDQEVFKDVSSGRTETVFQFHTSGAKKWLEHFDYYTDETESRKAIDSIGAMAAFTALDRPGPLDAYIEGEGMRHNMLVEYARRMRGEPPIGTAPIFQELLPETKGIMCVAEGQLVKTSRGLTPIQSVVPGDLVQTENGEFRPVLDTMYKGKKETLRIRVSNGEELCVTPDHRVLTANGWKEAGQLLTSDIIRQFWCSDGPIEEGDDRDWLVGLLLADGDVCASTPTVCCSSEEFAQKVKEIADRAYGLDCRIYKTKAWYCALRHKNASGTTPNPLTAELRRLGIKGHDCYTKKFPSFVTRSMLAGFYEGDGCVGNKRLRVKNEQLARGFFLGLQRARIRSALYEDEPGVWTVTVRGKLPLRIKEEGTDDVADFVPTPKVKVPRHDPDRQLVRRPFLGRDIAARLEKYGAAPDPYMWGKVVSVRSGRCVDTYDLSVDSVHSFVVGGSVVHNCFQEQLQKMYQNLTGCTGSEAEEFRTFVAKKKMDKVQKAYDPWMQRVGAKLGEENARKIWDFFVSWGQYGFNLSHSVCYSVIGYACAYLKRHFPLEWWCAVLSNASKNKVNESHWRHVGHIVDLPEVSRSGEHYKIVGDRIVAPITTLTGVADGALQQLLKYRPYSSILDFCQKKERHCIEGSTPVLDAAGAPVMVSKGRGKNKTQTPKIKRGKSALDRTICYKLIVSGCLDSLFPKEIFLEDGTRAPVDVTDKLMMFEAAEAEVRGKRQQPILPQYLETDALIRFQMKKALLPIYSEPLLGFIVKRQTPGITLRKSSTGRTLALYEWGGDCLPFVRPDKIKVLEEIEVLPEGEVIRVATPAYVVDSLRFQYAGKTKEAIAMTLDIEGVQMEVVKWPGRDGVLPEAFQEDLKGAVGIAVLKKYKEGKPFSLDDFVVVSSSLKKKENKDDENQEDGSPDQTASHEPVSDRTGGGGAGVS